MTLDATYFGALSHALDAAGECSPRLVVDAARLDANARKIADGAAPKNLRLVDKSLPAAGLLRRIAAVTGAQDVMSFHWPYMIQTAQSFPDAVILAGKPLPAAAARKVLAALSDHMDDAVRRIVWLVDSEARVRDYAAAARALGVRLSVSIEIDIGMRRGGAADMKAFRGALQSVLDASDALKFVGLMGYDAHVAKAGKALRRPAAAHNKAVARYRAFLDSVTAHGLRADDLMLNGAGSPTFGLHDETSPLNDVSIGSAFAKPSDFDLPGLEELEPAAFIATPILKRSAGVRIPYLEWAPAWLFGARDTLFVYSGRWMAAPVWPEGMAESKLYGLSSNQQMMTIPKSAPVNAGDWAFLRPTQSEAVLAQFGDIRVYEDGRIAERWPVYREEIAEGERLPKGALEAQAS